MKKISVVVPLAPDRDLEILESFNRYKKDIKLIVETGINPSRNRNKGAEKSNTWLVAFLNAHSILTENWAKEVKKFFKEHPDIDIVGGPQLTLKDDPIFERASGYALSSIFGAGEVRYRYKIKALNLNANEKHLTSANLICRRHVLKKIRFDEELWPSEDPKFISDAINAGFKVAYSPDITVYHKRRGNLSSLIKQIFNYGFTRTRKEALSETLKKPTFLVPGLFILYLLFIPTLALLNRYLLIPLLLYISLNLFFSLSEGLRNKDSKTIFLLPLLFFSIHASYGIGFLYGTLTKINAEKNI
mgnify:CR=1 FL=1